MPLAKMITVLFMMPTLLIMLLLAGCETVPAKDVLTMKAGTVVVLPADSLHKELAPFYGDVQHRLAAMMSKKGFEVITIEGREYAQLLSEALTISGSVYEPGMGKMVPLNRNIFNKAVIDLLAEKRRFDVIVMPEMVLRTANVDGDVVIWDGIKREFTWVKKPKDTYSLPRKATGLSLHLAVYTDHGAVVLSNYSGISLPYDVRMNDGRFVFDLKDPFFSKEELHDGVDLSLTSFFRQVKLDDE